MLKKLQGDSAPIHFKDKFLLKELVRQLKDNHMPVQKMRNANTETLIAPCEKQLELDEEHEKQVEVSTHMFTKLAGHKKRADIDQDAVSKACVASGSVSTHMLLHHDEPFQDFRAAQLCRSFQEFATQQTRADVQDIQDAFESLKVCMDAHTPDPICVQQLLNKLGARILQAKNNVASTCSVTGCDDYPPSEKGKTFPKMCSGHAACAQGLLNFSRKFSRDGRTLKRKQALLPSQVGAWICEGNALADGWSDAQKKKYLRTQFAKAFRLPYKPEK